MKINVSDIKPTEPPKVVDAVTAVEAGVSEIKKLFDHPENQKTAKEVFMSTAPAVPVAAAPHVSWLKKVGHFFGSILKFIGNDEQKIASVVTPALEAAFPQFAPLIAAGDALASKLTKVILSVETSATAIAKAVSPQDKLNAALAQINPDIDVWVAAAFPGSKPLSSAGRTALVNAFVTVANEVEADMLPPATA